MTSRFRGPRGIKAQFSRRILDDWDGYKESAGGDGLGHAFKFSRLIAVGSSGNAMAVYHEYTNTVLILKRREEWHYWTLVTYYPAPVVIGRRGRLGRILENYLIGRTT